IQPPTFNLKIPKTVLEIPNPDSKLAWVTEVTTPIVFKRFQKEILYCIETRTKQVIVASRQVGKTFALAAAAYAWCILYPEQTVLIVSTGEDHATEILDRVRWCFKNSKLKLSFERDSASEIRIVENGSRII